jgi:hypothetical protein
VLGMRKVAVRAGWLSLQYSRLVDVVGRRDAEGVVIDLVDFVGALPAVAARRRVGQGLIQD